MNQPRTTRRSETRPRPLDAIGVAAVLSGPYVLALVPGPVAVVIALSVSVACLVAYFVLGRRG